MIPITVVTGFLGAGKTSLIAHVLDNAAERKIAVVVNDLASESIDVAFLRGGEHIRVTGDDSMRVVAGGRAGSGKLADVIREIRSLAELPEPPEAIVVETSGSSPSAALASALVGDGTLDGVANLDSVVAVVDVTSFATYRKDRELRALLEDQIGAADLIVLSKSDRARFWQRRRTRRAVGRLNRDAEIEFAEFGRLPIEEIIATGRREARRSEEGADPHDGTSAVSRFQPVVARHINETRPFHPERLDAWLNEQWPGIIRIKGFVWIATDMEHVFVLDVAGSQRELGMEGTWYGALGDDELPDDRDVRDSLSAGPWQDRRQSITIIGTPEAVERELRRVRACLLSDPELDRGPRGWNDLPDPILVRFAHDEAPIEGAEGAETTEKDQSK